MRPLQFLRDLALLPSIWREAVRAERQRRYDRTPEALIAFEDERIAAAAGQPEVQARLRATAPSGRWSTERA